MLLCHYVQWHPVNQTSAWGASLGRSSSLWCSPLLWAENKSKARGREKSPSQRDHQSARSCSLSPSMARATRFSGRWGKFCDAKFEIKVSKPLQTSGYLVSRGMRGPYLQKGTLPAAIVNERCLSWLATSLQILCGVYFSILPAPTASATSFGSQSQAAVTGLKTLHSWFHNWSQQHGW